MNTNTKILFALLFTTFFTKTVVAQGLDDNQNAIVTSYIDSFPYNTQLAIAILENKAVTYHGFIKSKDGIITVENKDSIFEIGSITKVFTSTLLAKSVIGGINTLNTPIDTLLGFRLKGEPNITLQNLANHTSGLPPLPLNMMMLMAITPDDPYLKYSSDLLEEFLQKHLSLENVEQAYQYSNLGAGLLGYALAKQRNKSYESILREDILDPLGMNQTSTNQDRYSNNIVKGIKPDGSHAPNWHFDSLAGCGAILSSTKDLMKFVRKILKQDDTSYLLPLDETFKINDQVSIGLGWHFIHQGGKKIIWHNGGTGGYTSHLSILKDDQKAVIILSNVSAFHHRASSIDELGIALLGI